MGAFLAMATSAMKHSEDSQKEMTVWKLVPVLVPPTPVTGLLGQTREFLVERRMFLDSAASQTGFGVVVSATSAQARDAVLGLHAKHALALADFFCPESSSTVHQR